MFKLKECFITFQKMGMSCPMPLEVVLKLAFSFLLFSHGVSSGPFKHDYNTDELSLKSEGVLRNIVVFSEEKGIKRLLCKDNVILVALDNVTVAEEWAAGDLLVGGAEWGCVMTDRRRDHVELGFHRIIQSVHVRTATRVDINTRPAGLFDLFKNAKISYHHRPRSYHSRRRRSVVPWQARSEDLPLSYEIPEVKATPGWGRVRYDDETINTTLSFYEIRMLLDQVKFHESFSQILPINYNENGDNSQGFFGYENGNFRYNSTYFDDVMNIGSDDRGNAKEKRSSGESVDWSVHCENCYMYYLPEVLFELEIDQLIGVKNYTLKFSGQYETNVNLRGHSTGEVSVLLAELFHKTAEHVWISVPLVPEIEMKLVPKFNVTMESFLDLKMSGEGDFHFGFDQTGVLDITRTWTPDGQEQSFRFTADDSNRRSHDNDVTVNGELFYNMSMMTTKLDLASNIFWKLPENIFGFYLESPMRIRVEPNIIGRTVLNEDQIACVESKANILADIYMQDVVYDAELLGQKYDFAILPDKLNNTFHMMPDTAVMVSPDVCHIRCYGDSEVGDSINECGPPSQVIARGTPEFEKLVQLRGELALFAPEGSGVDQWCGAPGRACLECTHSVVGDTADTKCATRMVNKALAVKIDRLANWVVQEWPDRKLYVLAAWDEPTSSNPDGRFGPESLHYEGRAALVTLTKPLGDNSTVELESDAALLSWLGQFSVCAGLPYVKIETGHIQVATVNDTAFWSEEQQEFLDFFAKVPPQDLQFCQTYTEYFPHLNPGESIPSGRSIEESLGSIDNQILRRHDDLMTSRLFMYPYDNVEFEDEEAGAEWCGSPLRQCVPCAQALLEEDVAWSRCADRTMTPRAAAKLHALADLVSQQIGAAERVVVLEAWDEATSQHPQGLHHSQSLHYEGRALRLRLQQGGDLGALSHLALCAGFDAVHWPNDTDYIEAAVKNQEGYFTVYIPFLGAQLLQAAEPVFYEQEYAYPGALVAETRHGHLYDGAGEHAHLPLSADFRLGEFMAPLRRYVRVYPKLVQCLQATRDYIREPIEILAAYKPRSYNLVNSEKRHDKEKYRFQAGQAAEIRVTGYEEGAVVLDLARAVLAACSAQTHLDQHLLGVGFHRDRVYLHLKVATVYELDTWLDVWNVDGDLALFQQLQQLATSLLTAGPPVVPQFWETACNIPELGRKHPHYQIQLRPSCLEKSGEFCAHSWQPRSDQVAHLKEQMRTILGFADGPVFTKNTDVDDCFVTHCGSCNGGGSTWRKKLVACSNMLHSIKRHMFRELQENRGALFNTDNTNSRLHGLACRDGSVCLENTQMYSVFAPIIMATYRPDSERAQEVRLYEGNVNPNPIIDLLEQDFAMAMTGHVWVYIESEHDLSALKKAVKLLMAYNREVKQVHFHVNSTVYLDHVYQRIHDWIEVWRYDVCPSWGRTFLAPFSVDVIPEEEIVRTNRNSFDRNALQREIRNRNINWLLKM